jgi:sugar phosphate isomerase/epimerase
MLLGMSTSSYHLAAGLEEWQPCQTPVMRLEHFLRKAAELFLAGVTISDLRILERADYGYLSSLRRAAEQAGVFLEITYTGLRSDHLQDGIRVAGALGCKFITFYPLFERPLEIETMERGLEELTQILAESLPVAERYAVQLCLAGGGNLTADELLYLQQSANGDSLRFCLDIASAFSVLEDPVEWARTLGPSAASFRLSDYQIVASTDGARLYCCPFGEGIVDISGILEALRRHAPEICLVISTPSKILHLPYLEEDFLDRLQDLRPKQLARIVRLTQERGVETPPLLPQQMAGEDEVLAAEEERFEQSLEWLRGLLGEEQPGLAPSPPPAEA